MTTYELLKTIDADKFNLLVRNKILMPEWRRWLKAYEYFTECCKKTGRMEAYIAAGEKFYISSEQVRRIVRRMETGVY